MILTSPVHFLLKDHVFGRVWKEDGVILCAEVHPDKVRGRSGDRKDDVLLSGQVEGYSSDSQLAGKEKELPHGWKQETPSDKIISIKGTDNLNFGLLLFSTRLLLHWRKKVMQEEGVEPTHYANNTLLLIDGDLMKTQLGWNFVQFLINKGALEHIACGFYTFFLHGFLYQPST